MITKSNSRNEVEGLAKGQVWQLKHVYIQIVELGKRLLEYKMLDFLGQKGVKTQMSSVEVMRGYLESRHARLLRDNALAGSMHE